MSYHRCLVALCVLAGACSAPVEEARDRSTPPPGSVGCGDGVLAGFELCDGELFERGSSCFSYGLGNGTVSCVDCRLNFVQCSSSDLCAAEGRYADGFLCDPCPHMGGTPDPDCASLCGANGRCADYYDGSFGAGWTCARAGLGRDPDCGTCGNNLVEGNEPCDGSDHGFRDCTDWGYDGGGLACAAGCVPSFVGCRNFVCGDELVEGAEECDGNNVDGQTCQSLGWDQGSLVCGANCRFNTFGCSDIQPVCGDGIANGFESCDRDDLQGYSCVSLGYSGGTLDCLANCSFDVSRCIDCGDGIRNGSEQCDYTDLGGATCVSRGFDGGELLCSFGCTYDTSGCNRCGNDLLEATEECDGTATFETCEGLGYSGGTLTCTTGCRFETAACTECGDGLRNGNEECEGADLGDASCVTLGYSGGTLDEPTIS